MEVQIVIIEHLWVQARKTFGSHCTNSITNAPLKIAFSPAVHRTFRDCCGLLAAAALSAAAAVAAVAAAPPLLFGGGGGRSSSLLLELLQVPIGGQLRIERRLPPRCGYRRRIGKCCLGRLGRNS